MHRISSNPAPPPATRFFQNGGGGAACWLMRRWVGLPSRGMVELALSGAAAAVRSPLFSVLRLDPKRRVDKRVKKRGRGWGRNALAPLASLRRRVIGWPSLCCPACRGCSGVTKAQLGYRLSCVEHVRWPTTRYREYHQAPHTRPRSGQQSLNLLVGQAIKLVPLVGQRSPRFSSQVQQSRGDATCNSHFSGSRVSKNRRRYPSKHIVVCPLA